jgi:predicted transposase/invertase (TIGR01784 family)
VKTDSLFYKIFQTDPGILFELTGEPNPRASTYSFASQEVKQTSFRMDGILLPSIYAIDLPILFVEVQGYKDTQNVLYSSFFSQIFLYLHDYQPRNDWRAILIFTRQSLDPGLPLQYQDFADTPRFQRIYLDRLGNTEDLSLGLSLLQLVVSPPKRAPKQGRQLLDRTRQEIADLALQRKLIELIETTLVYKFPDLSRQEIEAMLGLNELKQTRVYQEAWEEGHQEGRQEGRQEGEVSGKLAAVPLLLEAGMTVEQIAERLQLDVTIVQQIAEQ